MGWYDVRWANRKLITLTGTADGAQTNYQLKLTVSKSAGTDSGAAVYLGTKVQDDFDDLIFTKSDGTTLLDYWRESYVSGTSAVVWIEFDSIPASPNTAVFYVYYNNSGASAISNGANTFIFFDDFSGDKSNWTEETNSGTLTVAGGVLTIDAPASKTFESGTDTAPKLYKTITPTNFAAYVYLPSFNSAGNWTQVQLDIRQNAANHVGINQCYNTGFGGTYRAIQARRTKTSTSATVAASSAGVYAPIYFQLKYLSGVTYFYYSVDNITWTALSSYTLTLTTRDLSLSVYTVSTYNPVAESFDNCYVTNSTTTPPTWTSWGAEESPSAFFQLF